MLVLLSYSNYTINLKIEIFLGRTKNFKIHG